MADFRACAMGAVIAVSLMPLVGCDQGIELGAVTGRVTKNGQPQPNLWVHFKPEDGRPGEGRTNSDGQYEIVYTINRKGATVGRHQVKIYSGGETDSRDNLLSPRVEIYTTHVDVASGDNRFDFAIE